MAAAGPARVFGLPDVAAGEGQNQVDGTAIKDLRVGYPTLAALIDRADADRTPIRPEGFKLVLGHSYDAVFAAPGTCARDEV